LICYDFEPDFFINPVGYGVLLVCKLGCRQALTQTAAERRIDKEIEGGIIKE
jgi:hypothetical protein